MRTLKLWLYLSIAAFALSAQLVQAEAQTQDLNYVVPNDAASRYVAKIELHTADEVEQMLKRAEEYVENIDKYPDFEPIAVILHGPELQIFNRKNYRQYKDIVGLAARLEAFNVIDVQVCEVQMMQEGIKLTDLPAFVEPVPYGPAEEQRLLKKGYQYF